MSDFHTSRFIYTALAPLVNAVKDYGSLKVSIASTADLYDFQKTVSNLCYPIWIWEHFLIPDDVNLVAQIFWQVLSYFIDRHILQKTIRDGSRVH